MLTPSQQSARREIRCFGFHTRSAPARTRARDPIISKSRHVWFEAISDYYRDLSAKKRDRNDV